jgi:glycosyltransferase involved in cell wall biosynthesis
MKILIVNFSDKKGGASRAAKRLHDSLLGEKVNSTMFVLDKNGTENNIVTPKNFIRKITTKVQKVLNPFPLRNVHLVSPFSASFSPSFNIVKYINQQNADVVHLHWINAGMLRIEDLSKIKAPIIWTLHDMWPFTGGCHYADSCKRYTESCGNCPILNSDVQNDLSKQIFNRKKIVFNNISSLTIVGLSKWLQNSAKASSLFKNRTVVNLPNPIDTNAYKPSDKNEAREFLGLSKEKIYILFGAMDATSDNRKGFDKLIKALSFLEIEDLELLVFGSNKPKDSQNFGFVTHYFGEISDDKNLNKIYNAADVMIVPSLQENLSNVIMESLSCGTPVVAFNVGGNSDMIYHKKNGYLAKALDPNDLALGIEWVIKNNTKNYLGELARLKVLENFDSKTVAKKYLQLYNDAIEQSN